MDMEIQRGPEKYEDARIKSPDEILMRRAPNPQPLTSMDLEKAKAQIAALQTDLKDLRHRYNTDINAWKEYEKRVVKWKELVMQVVQQMKTGAKIKSK